MRRDTFRIAGTVLPRKMSPSPVLTGAGFEEALQDFAFAGYDVRGEGFFPSVDKFGDIHGDMDNQFVLASCKSTKVAHENQAFVGRA